MNIIGVAACTAGIAHTYISKEKFSNAAKEMGHNVHVETQGTIGIEDELTPKQIEEADYVVFMADVSVRNKERFANKKCIEVSTDTAIKSPKKLVEFIEKKNEENKV